MSFLTVGRVLLDPPSEMTMTKMAEGAPDAWPGISAPPTARHAHSEAHRSGRIRRRFSGDRDGRLRETPGPAPGAPQDELNNLKQRSASRVASASQKMLKVGFPIYCCYRHGVPSRRSDIQDVV